MYTITIAHWEVVEASVGAGHVRGAVLLIARDAFDITERPVPYLPSRERAVSVNSYLHRSVHGRVEDDKVLDVGNSGQCAVGWRGVGDAAGRLIEGSVLLAGHVIGAGEVVVGVAIDLDVGWVADDLATDWTVGGDSDSLSHRVANVREGAVDC